MRQDPPLASPRADGTTLGLSSGEAARRLAQHGPNEIGDREHHGIGQTLKAIATEPMFALLLAAAAIYLVIGDLGEGLLLAFFALVTVGLVLLQECRSERALDALRELAVPHVRAIRDGALRRIPACELVPGDAFRIGEGERVAADAVLRDASALAVDESLLTGESVPVRKVAAPRDPAVGSAPSVPGGDDTPHVYAGTLVVAGHGIAEAVRTGRATHVGGIGASLAGIDRSPTPLEGQLGRLVRAFGIAAVVVCGLLVAWYGTARGDWVQGVLAGVALAMAMLPEEFPMALAVILALGAWRLAHIRVLARRPAVIEALGAATVLCVDKTGTLTENRMRLRRLTSEHADVDLAREDVVPEALHRLLEAAMLASNRTGVDPMDRAIVECGDAALAGTEHLHRDWMLQREYPLTPQLLAMSHAWGDEQVVRHHAAKGAPEAVAELCRLDPAARTRLLERVDVLARDGLRVLAVAAADAPGAAPVPRQQDAAFRLLGLLGFEDPVRPSVPAAVAEARGAGVRVVMITGDHVATALAIARQAGLDTQAGALTGATIECLDDAALSEAVRRVRVCARVLPEQKLRLVRALRANGEIVAMTGDGVNDAPALKAAHIGIAMGGRGTDVAREASSLVLLDDDFGRIVASVRMGRRIYDNLRKVMTYITAIHVPIAGLALLPLAFGWPPLMLPVHVVLTEMVIDPICSLAFEGVPEDPRIMQRPPRRADETLVGWPMVWRGLLQGAVLLAVVLAIDGIVLRREGEDAARALSFVALTAGNLMLVWVNAATGVGARALWDRSFAAFWGVAALATAVIAAALAFPALRRLLHFGPVSTEGLVAAVAAVTVGVSLASALTRGRSSQPGNSQSAAAVNAT